MQVQVNTGNGIDNKETLERWANDEVTQHLQRFSADLTRIEVHLSDENHAANGAGDKRCTMEARLAHHQPVTVTHHAANMDLAFRGATDKLKRALDSALGKQNDHRQRTSIRRDPDAVEVVLGGNGGE